MKKPADQHSLLMFGRARHGLMCTDVCCIDRSRLCKLAPLQMQVLVCPKERNTGEGIVISDKKLREIEGK